jgi:long-chain fatty acid transport protein
MRSKGLWVMGLGVLVGLLASQSWAAGLILYEVNSPSTGTASAGWAALAKDASTAFQNPAGMTRLDQSQLLVGVQPLIVTSEFNSGAGTRVMGGGDDGGNAGGVLPSAGGYYVYSASDRFKLGLSVLSYFGAALDYGDTWVGRYRVEKTAFITATIAPSLAYRINNWLSVGAMLNITYAYFKNETAVNNLIGPDGQVSYKDIGAGVGGGFGVLIEPTESTRLGMTYYSPVGLNFNDTPSFSGLGPVMSALFPGRRLGLTYTIPQWLMVSGYQQVTDDLAIMANFGWQDWSQFGSVDVSLQEDLARPGAFTTNLNMKNTYHAALGAQYRIAKPWLISLGFAYDSSPMSEENRSPSLPLDRNWRGAAGIQYEWSKNLTLGFAYEYINLGSANINKQGGLFLGTLEGDYSPNMINVVNLNLIYKF